MTDLIKAEEKRNEWEITSDVPVTSNEERARICKEKIESAYKSLNTGFYDLAVSMAEAAEYDYHKLWGYKTLEEYFDQSLGMDRRKAYDIIACGRAIRLIPELSRERIEAIGWSKFGVVARCIELSPSNAEKYLELAENYSYRELRGVIAKLDANEALPPPGEVNKQTFMLKAIKFDEETGQIVKQAVESAMEQIQTRSVSDAISRICADWLLLQGEVADLTVDHWIEFLQSRYGVTVTAVPQTDVASELSLVDDKIFEKTAIDGAVRSVIEKKTGSIFDDDDDELEKLLS